MIVIGAGRVGASLAARSQAHDIEVTLVTRTAGDEAFHGPVGDPIVVATRNDDLLGVIERVPEWRHQDLVFVQNGMIRGLLANNRLSHCTRGLLYFAATQRGGPIEGSSASWFCGPHALTMARWFGLIGLRARPTDWATFSFQEFEKLAWLCLFGPLCEKHDATVGQVVQAHGAELRALADEFGGFGRAVFGVEAQPGWLAERLAEYSLTIPDYRARVGEWEWRNGAVLRELVGRRVKLPLHLALLQAAGHGEKIPAALLVR